MPSDDLVLPTGSAPRASAASPPPEAASAPPTSSGKALAKKGAAAVEAMGSKLSDGLRGVMSGVAGLMKK